MHSSVLDHGFHTVQTIDSGHFVEELMPCADPSMCQQPPLCLLWVELYVKESVAGPVPAWYPSCAGLEGSARLGWQALSCAAWWTCITQELLQNVQQVPNHYARWTWWNIDPFVSEPSDICSIKNRKNIELLRDYGATDIFENDVFDCSLQQGHGCIDGFSFWCAWTISKSYTSLQWLHHAQWAGEVVAVAVAQTLWIILQTCGALKFVRWYAREILVTICQRSKK